MTLFVQRERATCCGQPVYWNDETKELTCGCRTSKAMFVNLNDFLRIKSRQEVRDAKVLASFFPEAPEFVNGKRVWVKT